VRNRRWLLVVAATMAAFLSWMSVGWACGTFSPTDMKLENADDQPWDGPGDADVGKNFSDCAVGRWATTPHGCVRPVTVTGKNFENSTDVKTITSVDLYWLDEPFYAAGLGGPEGAPEQLESKLCIDKGVFLGSAAVNTKAFTTTVNVPPTANQTTDGTYRLGATPLSPPDSGKFYYGLNAICAVWDHTTPSGSTHKGSIGNGYNLWF
jgi:hypothetical protein